VWVAVKRTFQGLLALKEHKVAFSPGLGSAASPQCHSAIFFWLYKYATSSMLATIHFTFHVWKQNTEDKGEWGRGEDPGWAVEPRTGEQLSMQSW
jgi:hypothetical protein